MIIDLNAKVRTELKKKSEALRAEGLVPGVIYGPELEKNINISIDINSLEKAYTEGGESTMINLQVEGEKEPREVLIKDMVFEPVIDRPFHVDFYQIKRGQKLDIEPELEFVGVSLAVKSLGGILVKNLSSISIRCLPRDMMTSIEVDISKLATFEDKISVKDLPLPEEVELLTDPEEMVAAVQEPAEEEVIVPEVTSAEEGAEGGDDEKKEGGDDEKKEGGDDEKKGSGADNKKE